ncbi:DUF2461 family protein [Pseudonocardia zijingensis]|uniref:TIGR02453 family protein n=1 Tax=Pseudonocardia zijingensis TaxID=153376 RepID=A0ABN1NGV4_9PSEU
MTAFTGWPADATAFLAEIEADNTREFWTANAHRHAEAVHGPMRALAAVLEPEFGPLRVLRPHRNRRFLPTAPPYRTDTGGVARSPGGAALTVVLSATALTTAAGHWAFDTGQLRRYRVAVLEETGEELPALLAGHVVDGSRSLRGVPRGFTGGHERIELLRLLGLQVVTSRPAGPWLSTPEPLGHVRAAWRAAAPVVAWLDRHVGPADPVPPRPRPAP